MADNLQINAGTGPFAAADELTDVTLGGIPIKVQYIKIMDGTLDGTAKAAVGVNGLRTDITGAIAMDTGTRSATTQRVTIATNDVVPASQSGIWTVQPGNTANTTPWLTTASQGGTWTVQPGNTANTTPWLTRISDGINPVDVKAASTAATATDRAVVVAISPNGQNPNGSAADANSTPVAWSTEGKAQVGLLTETAPATDTASSGLNGRLQRVAQNITTMTAASLKSVLTPTTTGGLVFDSRILATGTPVGNIKASAGQLYGIEITNNSATIGYLKLYNTAGTPTAGAGTPVMRFMCPASASGSGIVRSWDNGIAFGTGIGFAFTGGIDDANTTSIAASTFILNFYYK